MIRPRLIAFAAVNPRTSDCTCKVASVLTLSAAILTLAGATSAAAQNHPQSDSGAFMVSISEATIDNKNAVTSTDCILVLPDGRFHLERRKEVAPNPTSSLSIFESSLDSTRLQELQDILKDEAIKRLPDYTLPVFPMTVPWFTTVNAKIGQGGQVRKVGYWGWRGGSAEASPNSTPDNIKNIWKDSQTTLKPLVEWFHAVERLKLSPSGANSTLCDNADEISKVMTK